MKVAVILFAAVASVHSAAVPPPIPPSSPSGWSSTTQAPSGWSSTTQGWSTTAAPGWPSSTTQGWSTTAAPGWPSSTTQGWSTTAAPGWPSSTTQGWSTTAAPGWPSSTTQGWSTTAAPGWPSSTTQGWSTTAAPGWPSSTTQGWSTTTPGWSGKAGWSSTTPGWPAAAPAAPLGTITNIELDAALAAAGSGWAGENHAENVQVTGAGGWGPNAELVISAGGESVVDQAGSILQVTSQDSEQASSLNIVSVGQIAEGSEGEIVDASGLEISNIQSGWAAASGEGASAAEADSVLTVNPAPLGMAKP